MKIKRLHLNDFSVTIQEEKDRILTRNLLPLHVMAIHLRDDWIKQTKFIYQLKQYAVKNIILSYSHVHIFIYNEKLYLMAKIIFNKKIII